MKKIKDEKIQEKINRVAAKISALSSGKKEVKVYLFSFRKSIWETTKTIENQCEKQIKTIEEQGKQLVESNALI